MADAPGQEVLNKGAPAWESCTGTRLVSPATGCQKKKKHLWSRASEHKIEYIRNIFRSKDAMKTDTAPGKPLKAESGWKKRKKKRNTRVLRHRKKRPGVDFFFKAISAGLTNLPNQESHD